MLVILRVTIGWHFLYEGVWKISNPDFSAKPFLTQAKGPAAPLFYKMVPDIDGAERLEIRQLVDARPIKDAWKKTRQDAVDRYAANLSKRGDQAQAKQSLAAFVVAIDKILWEHEDRLDAYLAENQAAMVAQLAPRKEPQPGGDKPHPDKQLSQWLSDLRKAEGDYHNAVIALAKKDLLEGEPLPNLAALVPETGDGVATDEVEAGVAVQTLLSTAKGLPILTVGDGIPGRQYLQAWEVLKEDVVGDYELSDGQAHLAERECRRYKESATEYLSDSLDDISGYFDSLDRLEARKAAGTNGAAHEKKRIWDEQQKLRSEVNGWLSELDQMGEDYQLALWDLLNEDQKAQGEIRAPVSETDIPPISLPYLETRMELLDFAVTYGLTAIGVCLVLGFCTRLAALGGAAFLLFVLLTQPPWPTIYPPAPEVVGHALIVDKNFVEMIGLLVLAATAVGRWAGLDYFVYRWLGKPILSRFGRGGEGDED